MMRILTKNRVETRIGSVAALTVALGLPLAACDDDPAGPGGETGGIEAVVVDDESSSPAIAGQPGGVARSVTGQATFTGDIEGDFQASISADGQTWIDLGSLNGITVDLQSSGTETSVHGQQSVAAGTYTRVRLIIDDAEAELAAGSTIGGITLGVDSFVSIGGPGPVVVELTVPAFTIEADATARLLFDLNSEAWITESVVTLGSAAAAEVAANVAAGVSMTTN